MLQDLVRVDHIERTRIEFERVPVCDCEAQLQYVEVQRPRLLDDRRRQVDAHGLARRDRP